MLTETALQVTTPEQIFCIACIGLDLVLVRRLQTIFNQQKQFHLLPRVSPIFLPISAALRATPTLAPSRLGPDRGTGPGLPGKPGPGSV